MIRYYKKVNKYLVAQNKDRISYEMRGDYIYFYISDIEYLKGTFDSIPYRTSLRMIAPVHNDFVSVDISRFANELEYSVSDVMVGDPFIIENIGRMEGNYLMYDLERTIAIRIPELKSIKPTVKELIEGKLPKINLLGIKICHISDDEKAYLWINAKEKFLLKDMNGEDDYLQ